MHTRKDHWFMKLEDLKVLRRSPALLNNVKIGQGQLQLIVCLFVLLLYVPSQQLWSLRDG